MQAHRLILETNQYGHLIHPPTLPANAKLEAIFLLLDEHAPDQPSQPQLTPEEKNQKLIELLAGSATGPADLSENYKNYLEHGWKEKHAID